MSVRVTQRGARARLARFFFLLLVITMGPGRSSSLRIGGDSSVATGLGWTGGASDRSTGVNLRDSPREPPFPLNKGKGRIDEIKYPGGSEYLKSAV